MVKLLKCPCNMVIHDSVLKDHCPKCSAPRNKLVKLSEEQAKKIYSSDKTNDIHMNIINLTMAIEELAAEGKE